MELIDPYSKSAYLCSGLPSLGSRVQDFIVTADDFELAIFSNSRRVTSAGPAALKIHVSSLTPAIFVEISTIYINPIFLAQFAGSSTQSDIISVCSFFRKPFSFA